MLQHIMLIKCVLVLNYSQSTVFHYLHQLLWGGMADVTKYKKRKMLKVKLQFSVEKRDAATCFYYKATSQNYSLGGKWAATRPHNWKICQKYLTCLFFSSALTLYIFTHSWCQKKHGFVLCRMEKLHLRKWRREYSEIWLWWRHDILLGRELNENSPSRWNEGWSCVFLSELWFFLVNHVFTLPWLLLQMIVIKIGWRWWWCREVTLCWVSD